MTSAPLRCRPKSSEAAASAPLPDWLEAELEIRPQEANASGNAVKVSVKLPGGTSAHERVPAQNSASRAQARLRDPPPKRPVSVTLIVGPLRDGSTLNWAEGKLGLLESALERRCNAVITLKLSLEAEPRSVHIMRNAMLLDSLTIDDAKKLDVVNRVIQKVNSYTR